LGKRAFCETEVPVEAAVLDCLENPSIDTVLFVDAADFKGEPGEMRLFGASEAGQIQPAFSTHKVPLDLLIGMVLAKGKNAFLLGIRPESMEWLGQMGGAVLETINELDFFRPKT